MPADIPGAGEQSLQTFQVISFFEGPVELARFLDENDVGVTFQELFETIASPAVAALFQTALEAGITEEQYNQVIDEGLPQLRGAYRKYLADNGLDAVIYPTTILPAAKIGQDHFVEFNGLKIPTFEAYLKNTHYTPVVGAPTVTVPIGQTRKQLPAGDMDIAGAAGEDRRVLAVADAI